MTEYAAKHESRFVKLLIQQNEIGGKRKTAAATKQLEQAQERIAEVNRIIKRLYEDNVNGKISDERFMELSADYEQEQRELKDLSLIHILWRENAMSKLLPYETIVKAHEGDPDAIDTVLSHYAGYIRYCSKVHGKVSAEVEEHIKQKLIAALFKFRFDR